MIILWKTSILNDILIICDTNPCRRVYLANKASKTPSREFAQDQKFKINGLRRRIDTVNEHCANDKSRWNLARIVTVSFLTDQALSSIVCRQKNADALANYSHTKASEPMIQYCFVFRNLTRTKIGINLYRFSWIWWNCWLLSYLELVAIRSEI